MCFLCVFPRRRESVVATLRQRHQLRVLKKFVAKWKRVARVRSILRRADIHFPRGLSGVCLPPTELDTRLLGPASSSSSRKPVFQDLKSVHDRYHSNFPSLSLICFVEGGTIL